jgi:pimeloyl-ACP methyl ester carboxylesterase
MSARSWTDQLHGLGHTLSVLAVDLPGHGESDPSAAASVDDYARAVEGMVDALGLGPVIAAGHSLGGAVAIALAGRRPDAVRGLVLLSSCAKVPHTDGVAERILASLPGPLRRMIVFSMAKRILFAPGAPARAVALGMDELRACPPETLLKDVRAGKAMDVADRVARLDVPALIMCGSRDRLIPPELSESLHRLIPRSRLCIVEGAGHMLPLEAPDRVNQEILQFVGSLGTAAVVAPAPMESRRRSLTQRALDGARRLLSALRDVRGGSVPR